MNNIMGVIVFVELFKVQKLVNCLDIVFKFLFILFCIGFDVIIGLILGLGDVVMFIVVLRIVYFGKKMGFLLGLVKVMLCNVLFDFGLGFIFLVGDIVDFFYKVNQVNVCVMEKYWVSQNKDVIDVNVKFVLEVWLVKQQ